MPRSRRHGQIGDEGIFPRLASQWEDIVNASLLALEKESIRRLDGLIGTIEKLIASAGQLAPQIREDLQQIENARRDITEFRLHTGRSGDGKPGLSDRES